MKGMYLWQANGMAERSLDAIAATLATGGVEEIRFKAGQFTTWSGHFDHGGAWSINSIADVQAISNGFASHGIRSYPWVVPMGLDTEAEAQFAAAIARVTGRLDLDVEPGEQFWPAVDRGDYSAVVPYFSRLRELVGDQVELTLDFPGKWAWPYLTRLLQLAEPYVDRFAIQSYFGAAVARSDEQRLRALTAKPVDHIADVAHVPEMLDWLASVGAGGALVWDAAHMNTGAYAALAAAAFPTQAPAEHVWQEPGFSALRQAHPEMGDPAGEPYSDSQGNVWQDGSSGRALWIRDFNADFWLPKKGAA